MRSCLVSSWPHQNQFIMKGMLFRKQWPFLLHFRSICQITIWIWYSKNWGENYSTRIVKSYINLKATSLMWKLMISHWVYNCWTQDVSFTHPPSCHLSKGLGWLQCHLSSAYLMLCGPELQNKDVMIRPMLCLFFFSFSFPKVGTGQREILLYIYYQDGIKIQTLDHWLFHN